MQFQPNPTSIRSLISRRLQISFVLGLVLGIVLGWALSGVVSAIVRFGLLAVLLVPLILVVWLWWRMRSAKSDGKTTVVTWSSTGLPPVDDELFRNSTYDERHLEDVLIDLDEIRRERKS